MYLESFGLRIEATVYLTIGAHRNAVALCTRARELLCKCGLKGFDTDYMVLSVMGETYCLKSEYSEAQEIHMQIKNATSDQQHSSHHTVAVLNLAEITIITGQNLDHIAQTLNDQKKIFAAMPHSAGMASCDLVMSDFHLHKDHNTLAAQVLLLQHTQSVNREITSYSLEQLANLKYWGICASALSSIGHILLVMGDLNTAQSLFTVALERFTWMDVHRSRAECMLHVGEISQQRRDFEGAISCFKVARPLFECSSQAKDVEHIDSLVRALEEEIEGGQDMQVTDISTLNVPTEDIVTATG
ncbi:hypothetical protein B0H14DRAFT_2617265 [Mycena olivaceomarginata]|nr:hypothetical protein B0H14DRAFT_2617265 [Mycena olivaceomarginata]